jgi:transcriptional regulator with XRE-family HTH domain
MQELAVLIGKNIRHARKEKGYSQESLALNAKLDRSYVGRIERGEANITVELLYKLAAVIKCDAKSLLP